MITKITIKAKNILQDTTLTCEQYNLIFGYNGTGKSTLAKIFLSLEENKEDKTPEYTVTFDSNNITRYIRVFIPPTYLKNNFEVNNTNPIIFTIGEENIALKKKRDRLKNCLDKTNKKIDELKNKITSIENERSTTYTSTAKIIKETLAIPNYTKTNLEKDIKNITEKDTELSEEDYKKNKRLYESNEIKDSITISINKLNIPTIKSKALLQERYEQPPSIGEKILYLQEKLKNGNDDFKKFIELGIKEEEFHNKKCPFCSNTLNNEVYDFLQEYFNDTIKKHKDDLNKLKNMINEEKNTRKKIIESLPNAISFFSEYVHPFEECISGLEKKFDAIQKVEDALLSQIDAKLLNPYTPITEDNAIEYDSELEDDIIIINEYIDSIITIITEHNTRITTFTNQKEKSKENLIKHYLIPIKKTNDKNNIDIEKQKQYIEKQSCFRENVQDRINEINKILNNYTAPIEEYNKDIHAFLGRDDITIDYDKEKQSYYLLRNKYKTEYTTFSEGEKTAIALVHFLLSLKNELKGNIENCIVVIDDPISSLDSDNLYSAYGFLSSKLNKVHQIFILTHNFYFFKRIQNWFDIIKKKKKKIISYLHIIRKGNTSTIKKCSDFIIHFETEYQYLYNRLYNFSQLDTISSEDCVSIPNECRRVLESITSVILPLHTKPLIDVVKESKHINNEDELERIEASLNTIYRFTNTESHNKYINNFADYTKTPNSIKQLLKDFFTIVEIIIPNLKNSM